VPVVVADTGPLHYLVLIGHIDLLAQMFRGVSIAQTVQAELTHAEAPRTVRDWAAAPPAWLGVLPAPMSEDPALSALDDGERATIALAASMRADLIVMDDRAGVAAARARGFAVTGTLGLLDLAARRDLIDLAAAFARLRATSFRCRPELLDALLLAWREASGR